MQMSKLVFGGILITALLIGGYIGAQIMILHYVNLQFSSQITWEVDPFSILHIFITIALTVFVVTHLDRKSQLSLKEKELIIDQVNKIEDHVESIISLISQEQEPSYPQIAASFKILLTKLAGLKKITLVDGNKNMLDKIGVAFDKAKNIRDDATNTERIDEKSIDRVKKEVKNNILRLQEEKIQQLLVQLEDMKHSLQDLCYEILKC